MARGFGRSWHSSMLARTQFPHVPPSRAVPNDPTPPSWSSHFQSVPRRTRAPTGSCRIVDPALVASPPQVAPCTVAPQQLQCEDGVMPSLWAHRTDPLSDGCSLPTHRSSTHEACLDAAKQAARLSFFKF